MRIDLANSPSAYYYCALCFSLVCLRFLKFLMSLVNITCPIIYYVLFFENFKTFGQNREVIIVVFHC